VTRLAVIGGFLGAGKTSLLIALAKRLAAEGRRVAVVTNDQGERLVDTAFVRAFGFEAVEVSHGCFCCNFSRFAANLRRFVATIGPELILAEPVGSCTDLSATVIAPLLRYHGDVVELAPYLALADGRRAAEGGYGRSEEGDEVSLLLAHQVEEAQLVAVSKSDLLGESERSKAGSALSALNPEARIVFSSALSGEGLAELEAVLLDPGARASPRPVPIDYARYAAAEAAYGWYDATWTIRAEDGFQPYAYAAALMRALADWDSRRRAAGPPGTEAGIAHAKLLLLFPDGAAKFSLSGGAIRSDETVLGPGARREGAATLNIRARAEPEELRGLAAAALSLAARRSRCANEGLAEDGFVPGYPKPEMRIV